MRDFRDTIVIYFSSEDGCWVAHGLETDQLGYGERIVDALADVIRAVDQVIELAAEDQTVEPRSPAPEHIRRIAPL